MLVYKKNKNAIHLHVIPVMKCGCVFWEFAKRKLVTLKDKIRQAFSLKVECSFWTVGIGPTKLFNKPPLVILNGTSNPIGLHNEHSLFQRISIHLHYDVKSSKHLASLLITV
jgi:hypothetical protein